MNVNKVLSNHFDNSPSQLADINDFPNEVLSKIFAATPVFVKMITGSGYDTTNLDSIACVSKRWNSVCLDLNQGPYVHLFRKQFSEHARFGSWGSRRSYKEWVMLSQGELKTVAWNAVRYDLELLFLRIIDEDQVNINDRYCTHGPHFLIEFTPSPETVWGYAESTTLLGVAAYHNSRRCLNILIQLDWLNCNEKIFDLSGHSLLDHLLHRLQINGDNIGRSIATNPTLGLVLKNKEIELRYPEDFPDKYYEVLPSGEKFSERGSIYFLTHHFEDLKNREPQELVDLYGSLPFGERADEHRLCFAKIVKAMGYQRFGNFYYHILSLVGDESIKEELKRVKFYESDVLGFSLHDMIMKYKNFKLLSNMIGCLQFDEIQKITLALFPTPIPNGSKPNLDASNFVGLFREVLLRNDIEKNSKIQFYNNLIDFSSKYKKDCLCLRQNTLSSFYASSLQLSHRLIPKGCIDAGYGMQLDLVVKNFQQMLLSSLKEVLDLKAPEGGKRPLEPSSDIQEPDQKKAKKE